MEKSEKVKNKRLYNIAEPHDLSPRQKWLRDYYFKGAEREWANENMAFTTDTDWDIIYHEGDYYVSPEVYYYIGSKGVGPFATSIRSMAQPVKLPDNFWDLSLPERKVLFFKDVLVNYVPQEIISENDLIAGGRFNMQLSKCLNEKEAKNYWKQNIKTRKALWKFHKSGFGNVGATAGHLIPDHESVVKKGFKHFHDKAEKVYNSLSKKEKDGPKGQELRAMIEATTVPRDLALKYAEECRRLKD